MGSSVQIRRFMWQDLPGLTFLFNEVNGISNTEKANDVEFMQQFLSQPSCKPEEHCFLAKCGDDLVGFALVAPEPAIGRAVASGGVASSHRGNGIGRRLARTAIEHASKMDASVLHVQISSQAVVARHMLESMGFCLAKNYWQMRWEGGEFPPVDLPRGFFLRAFRLGQDEEVLTQLQNSAFGQHWGFCPNTVDEISARVRFKRCDPEGIIFVVDGSRPAGYNWTMRECNEAGSVGWVSMTGVHPDYRGRGLGTAVVVTGMEYLKAKGVDGIELEVDSENVPARELYLKLGFRKVHETVWLEKRL